MVGGEGISKCTAKIPLTFHLILCKTKENLVHLISVRQALLDIRNSGQEDGIRLGMMIG